MRSLQWYRWSKWNSCRKNWRMSFSKESKQVRVKTWRHLTSVDTWLVLDSRWTYTLPLDLHSYVQWPIARHFWQVIVLGVSCSSCLLLRACWGNLSRVNSIAKFSVCQKNKQFDRHIEFWRCCAWEASVRDGARWWHCLVPYLSQIATPLFQTPYLSHTIFRGETNLLLSHTFHVFFKNHASPNIF